ncbi:MAG: ArsR/SmtB family transcription factor [Acidimicrobiales bacterium]
MTNGSVEAALAAVGNPTRRVVLEMLRGGAKTVGELTELLPMTQSAVSQHMTVLRQASLVQVEEQGRRRLYSVDLDGLGEVRAWVDGFWDDVLGAFVEHVNESHANTPPTGQSPTSGSSVGDQQPNKEHR